MTRRQARRMVRHESVITGVRLAVASITYLRRRLQNRSPKQERGNGRVPEAEKRPEVDRALARRLGKGGEVHRVERDGDGRRAGRT